MQAKLIIQILWIKTTALAHECTKLFTYLALYSLDDKTVAFPTPNALGASLQMRQDLYDNFGVTAKPEYVKTHDSVYLNILLGEAVAEGGVQNTLLRQKQEYRDNLTIIHTTTKVAPHPFAVMPSVPA